MGLRVFLERSFEPFGRDRSQPVGKISPSWGRRQTRQGWIGEPQGPWGKPGEFSPGKGTSRSRPWGSGFFHLGCTPAKDQARFRPRNGAKGNNPPP